MSFAIQSTALRLNKRYAPNSNFPPVFLLSDDEKQPDVRPFLSKLPKGSAVLVRSRSALKRRQHIRQLRIPCRKLGLRLMVADDWKLAVAYHLDGVHFPEQRLKKFRFNQGRLRKPYPDFLITCSAHTLNSLVLAQNCGVKGVFISPIFPTTSHKAAKTLGRWRLAYHLSKCPNNIGAVGLGGINEHTIKQLRNCRLSAIAGISGLI